MATGSGVAASAAAVIEVTDMTVVAGRDAAFARLMRDVVPEVRNDPANLQFELYRSQDAPHRFMLYQASSGEAAGPTHPALGTALHAVADWFEAPPLRGSWRPVPVAHAMPAAPARGVGHATRSIFRLREGAEDRHFAALRAYVGGLLARGSMLRFDVSRSLDEPGAHMIFGRWDTKAAWAANEEEPGYLRFKASVKDDFAAPSRRDFWSAPLP